MKNNSHTLLKATQKTNDLITIIFQKSPVDEEWKEIRQTAGDYFVSNYGRVISLKLTKPRIMKPFNCNGYLYVSIDGHDRRIHRLVATAFIPNPEGKKIVHHKDGNKQNNKVSNLEWATASENIQAFYKLQRETENDV